MNIIKDILKSNHRLRTNKKTKMTSITIHSTGNPSSTALNERKWLDNPTNTRNASWHYVIGETDIVQAIPSDEVAWHSGTTVGNNTSIGVEIIESGDRLKVLQNSIKFVSKLLKERGWTTKELRKHKDWSGKDCPRILINDKYIKTINGVRLDWDWFINEIDKELSKRGSNMKELKSWERELGLESLKDLSELGIIEFDTWKEK